MKKKILFVLFSFTVLLATTEASEREIRYSPAFNAQQVNADTHFSISFPEKPVLTGTGRITICRKSDHSVVDILDMSIPPGPVVNNKTGIKPPYSAIPYPYFSTNYSNLNTKAGKPSGLASATSDSFQLNIIGHFTDAFHFYPVIIRNQTATIYFHNNMLEYGESYYIQIDPSVFRFESQKSYKGITDESWTIHTKDKAPSRHNGTLVVDASGNGDFSTLQAAIDYVPDFSAYTTTIQIHDGDYEEIIYFRNKNNINFIGESRQKTRVFYANNEVFNPHPDNLSTNEKAGTFPSRRAAFCCDNSSDIHFENFTIENTAKGQAEGLLIMGEHNMLKDMNIIGSGDALQINGSAYLYHCDVVGDGDTYLGRGPVYFDACRIYSKGTFAWVRNTEENHGIVFNRCELTCTRSDGETEIARAPENNHSEYPYCEAVLLHCKLKGISATGWGPVGKNSSHVHYWEYNSTNQSDGKAVNTQQRHAVSKQLDAERDALLIRNYEKPSYLLNGWNPNPLLSYSKKQFLNKNGKDSLRYLFLENKTEEQMLPLVVYLHGADERGSDNERQLLHAPTLFTDSAFRSKHNFSVLAPQCATNWVNGRIENGGYSMRARESDELSMLKALIGSVIESGKIDRKRVYLVGSVTGGCAVYELLSRYPEMFAGAVVVSGFGDLEKVKQFASIPIWIFHSKNDTRVSIHHARMMEKHLRMHGGQPEYTEFDEYSPDIMKICYGQVDLWEWLFDKKK